MKVFGRPIPRPSGTREFIRRVRRSLVRRPRPDIGADLQKRIDDACGKQVTIELPPGTFSISRSIRLNSNIVLRGSKNGRTRLVLADETNDHLFSNYDHVNGNYDILVEELDINGNSANQTRSVEDTRLSFCNLFYFKKLFGGQFRNISAYDCKQTAFHFNGCSDISISGVNCENLGWSGISTSGTDQLKATNTLIRNSGQENMHSAVHLDGGSGAFLECTVEICTGNGIMLDSRYAAFSKAVVAAHCTGCRRGISLSGAHENPLQDVLLQDCHVNRNAIGILVSNSAHVFIDQSSVTNSSDTGILLQGKLGARSVTISRTALKGNRKDLAEIHESESNYFVNNSVPALSKTQMRERPRPLDSYSGICTLCGMTSLFSLFGMSVRESYRCQHCRASLRHQGQAKALLEGYGEGERSIGELCSSDGFGSLRIYELGLGGPFKAHFRSLPNYVESYFWEDAKPGEMRDGVWNQDLQQLNFADNTIDLVLSSDVFEHIRKPYLAFRELHRVLKVGGRHVFTIPVQYPMPKETVYRVNTSTEKDVLLLPPQYYIAGDGRRSLVYTEFGADMLTELEKIGLKTHFLFVEKGHPNRGKNITFVSEKVKLGNL